MQETIYIYTFLLLLFSPRLSWRDVQHLVVLSSAPPPPPPAGDAVSIIEWQVNGAGRRSNVRYGFGALDANRLVSLGRHWINLPPQSNYTADCQISKFYTRQVIN